MKLIKVGAVALNQLPLDWAGNRSRILAVIEAARRAEVSVLCLPELCTTGYGCEDAFLSPNTIHRGWRLLKELLPATRGMIVSFGLPVLHQHGLFNCACLAVDGRIAGFTAKRFLAGDGIHYEPRWFKPWPQQIRNKVLIEGETFPLGDLYFDCGGVRIGFEICEDAWVANRPGATLALKGVDIILNPSAIRDKQGPLEVFELMRVQFANHPIRQLGIWIERFFRLWSRNQWKRERYAPSFHLDDENLDPKTWCRFPILSGGFEVELSELRSLISER